MSFHLCAEMLEVPALVAGFDPEPLRRLAARLPLPPAGALLTGEGSSRIFPAKQAIHRSATGGPTLSLATEGALQALEMHLRERLVVGASNSGATQELVGLFEHLRAQEHPGTIGMSATPSSPLLAVAQHPHLLGCGPELAVPATKSVVEQALVHRALVDAWQGRPAAPLDRLAAALELVLTTEVPATLVERVATASGVYFSGRNDGVAEELTLKAVEIARKKAIFVEGTSILHGIEEIMDPTEVVVLVEPFAAAEHRLREVLVQGVGVPVVALSTRPTRFETWCLPDVGSDGGFVQLAAGWRLLVEAGLRSGIDLDHPRRARKIGNPLRP